jgi:hypothetical protein
MFLVVSFYNKKWRAGGMAQGKSSNPSTTKKKKKKNGYYRLSITNLKM